MLPALSLHAVGQSLGSVNRRLDGVRAPATRPDSASKARCPERNAELPAPDPIEQ